MLLANCDMFFGNEGGPRHLAHSVGIPTFIIYRAGLNIKEWAIKGEKHGGVGPLDANPDANSLSLEEQNDLLTPELVTEKLEQFYKEKILKK